MEGNRPEITSLQARRASEWIIASLQARRASEWTSHFNEVSSLARRACISGNREVKLGQLLRRFGEISLIVTTRSQAPTWERESPTGHLYSQED